MVSDQRIRPDSTKRAIIVAVILLVIPPRCHWSPISSGTPLPFFRFLIFVNQCQTFFQRYW